MPIQYNEIANVAQYNQDNEGGNSAREGILSAGNSAWELTSIIGISWAPGKSRSATIVPNDALWKKKKFQIFNFLRFGPKSEV